MCRYPKNVPIIISRRVVEVIAVLGPVGQGWLESGNEKACWGGGKGRRKIGGALDGSIIGVSGAGRADGVRFKRSQCPAIGQAKMGP